MKNFDAYEFIGIIAPGAVVAVAIMLAFPAVTEHVLSKQFSLGSLGIFVIISFVLGHLVAAVGNIYEAGMFAITGGMPTARVRKQTQKVISSSQRCRVEEGVRARQGIDFSLESVSDRDWYSITREIYADVAAGGHNARIDSFNRQYGLLRGIASSLFVVTVWLTITEWHTPALPLTAAVATVLATIRMMRFAQTYARELFVQYVRVDKNRIVTTETALPSPSVAGDGAE